MHYFDKLFESQFRAVMNEMKRNTSSQFNLNNLGIPVTPLAEVIYTFATLKGIKENSVYSVLNNESVFISHAKELTPKGVYAFANKNKTLAVDKNSVLICSTALVKVPNHYDNPDSRIEYLGFERLESGFSYQCFRVSKELVYPKPTYVVSISTKTVPNHLGGRTLLLTNGRTINIVLQDRTKIRRTDAKSVYFISNKEQDAKSFIETVHNELIKNGRAFHPSYFKMEDTDNGIYDTYNLTYKELSATEDGIEDILEYSLAEKAG